MRLEIRMFETLIRSHDVKAKAYRDIPTFVAPATQPEPSTEAEQGKPPKGPKKQDRRKKRGPFFSESDGSYELVNIPRRTMAGHTSYLTFAKWIPKSWTRSLVVGNGSAA